MRELPCGIHLTLLAGDIDMMAMVLPVILHVMGGSHSATLGQWAADFLGAALSLVLVMVNVLEVFVAFRA
jgi:hypothetical protein